MKIQKSEDIKVGSLVITYNYGLFGDKSVHRVMLIDSRKKYPIAVMPLTGGRSLWRKYDECIIATKEEYPEYYI